MRRALRGAWFAVALLAVGVASPLGVGPGPASAADASVDLTGCLAPTPAAGDTRVFETSQGAQLTETVVDVAASRRRDGWAAKVEAQLGAHAPTVRETIVMPGRRLLLGDLEVGDLEIRVGDPERWLPLDAVPGRTYRANVQGKALRDGKRVGRAIVTSDWEILGFEPLTTPNGSYTDTVHIAATRDVEVKYAKGGPRVRQESDVEVWCVDGVGVVAATYAFRFYKDGKLVDEIGDLDSWLVSATVDGVSVN